MDLSKKVILSIDDDPYILVNMKKILANIGVKPLTALSVEEGLEMIEKYSPHLIFTDLSMPNITGLDFLKLRKTVPYLNDVPIIVLSAKSDKRIVYSAMALGAADYIMKPLQANIIIQKVKKHLKEKSFLSYELPNEELVTCLTYGEFVQVNSNKVILDSNLKIPRNYEFTCSGELFSFLDKDQVSVRTDIVASKVDRTSHYITVGNINWHIASMKEKLRKKIKGWR